LQGEVLKAYVESCAGSKEPGNLSKVSSGKSSRTNGMLGSCPSSPIKRNDTYDVDWSIRGQKGMALRTIERACNEYNDLFTL